MLFRHLLRIRWYRIYNQKKSRDTLHSENESYSKKVKREMMVGFFIILFTLGLGLIWFIYGRNAMLFGLLCLAGVLVPALAIILLMKLIDYFLKR